MLLKPRLVLLIRFAGVSSKHPYYSKLPIFQYLEEDPKTNRIDDSLQLFTAICSNKLLKDAQIVLLLNKVIPISSLSLLSCIICSIEIVLKLFLSFEIGRSPQEEAQGRGQSSKIVRTVQYPITHDIITRHSHLQYHKLW
jgi:hypothetical protein